MSVSKKKEPTMPKVYVVGGGFEYIRLMYKLGCDGAKGLDDADIVLFTGGEDVNPELYGEVPMAKTHYHRQRDDLEQVIYKGAIDRDIPMVGICRGGQFLNVMNGGTMWQHVNGHALSGTHLARAQIAPFNPGKKPRVINVTSTHHQMMIPAAHGMTILTAMESTEKHSPAVLVTGQKKDEEDTEVVFYDETNCLCFQPHPEFPNAPADCVDFFEECLDKFIYPNIPVRITEKIPAGKVVKGK